MHEELKALGSRSEIPSQPERTTLETFPNPNPNRRYLIQHETSEWTSLCPVTGQPDFATITISYEPREWCVESKSLKLYLQSYRNYHGFMEEIINNIASDLREVCDPRWLRVVGDYAPRGGVSSTVTVTLESNPSLIATPS
jgi:7-cyano-7-deazaguanine reductase